MKVHRYEPAPKEIFFNETSLSISFHSTIRTSNRCCPFSNAPTVGGPGILMHIPTARQPRDIPWPDFHRNNSTCRTFPSHHATARHVTARHGASQHVWDATFATPEYTPWTRDIRLLDIFRYICGARATHQATSKCVSGECIWCIFMT